MARGMAKDLITKSTTKSNTSRFSLQPASGNTHTNHTIRAHSVSTVKPMHGMHHRRGGQTKKHQVCRILIDFQQQTTRTPSIYHETTDVLT